MEFRSRLNFAAGLAAATVILMPIFSLAEPAGFFMAIPPNDVPNVSSYTLGDGWNSQTQMLRGHCARGKIISTPPIFNMNLAFTTGSDAGATSLGFGIGGRYRTGVTETSASAEFAKSSTSNSYTTNLVYEASSTLKESFDTNNGSVEVAPGYALQAKDVASFYNSCGDEIVIQTKKAAKLLVKLSVSFASKEEKQSFDSNFKFGSPNLDLDGKVKAASKGLSSNTSLSLQVLQVGGDAQKGGKMICAYDLKDKKGSAEKTADEVCDSSGLVKCGAGEFSRCIDLLTTITQYAGGDFTKQLSDPATGSAINFALTEIEFAPYVRASGYFPLPPNEYQQKSFDEQVRSLRGKFEEYFSAWSLANTLSYGKTPRLSSRQKNAVTIAAAKLQLTVAKITADITDCYTRGFDACDAASKAIDTNIEKNISQLRDAVAPFKSVQTAQDISKVVDSLSTPETFSQFCDLADDANPEIRDTVESMKHFVDAQLYALQLPNDMRRVDPCMSYQIYLERLTEIDLEDHDDTLFPLFAVDNKITSLTNFKLPIKSLAPLATLTGLKKLNLSGKGLSDVRGLSSLTQLEELSINQNALTNVCSLLQLPKLQTLDVQNNQVSSLSCPQISASLTMIDARENSPDLQCPLVSASDCRIMNFSRFLSVTPQNGKYAGIPIGASAMRIGNADRYLVAGGTLGNLLPGDENQAKAGERNYGLMICNLYGCSNIEPSPNNVRAVNGTKFNLLRLNSSTSADGTVGVATTAGYLTLVNGNSQFDLSSPPATLFFTNGQSRTDLSNGNMLLTGGYLSGERGGATISAEIKVVSFHDLGQQGLVPVVDYAGRLVVQRAEHTATLLKSGRVLIVGGYSTEQEVATAEIFDPQTNESYLLPAALNQGRFGHSAALLPDGKVVIAGGFHWVAENNESPKIVGLDSVEIFDPETETFTLLPEKLSHPRGAMEIQQLNDGRVMFLGGNGLGNRWDFERPCHLVTDFSLGREFSRCLAVVKPQEPKSTPAVGLSPVPRPVPAATATSTPAASATPAMAATPLPAALPAAAAGGDIKMPTVGDIAHSATPAPKSAEVTQEPVATSTPSPNAEKAASKKEVVPETVSGARSEIDIYDPNTQAIYKAGKLSKARSQMTSVKINDGNSIIIVGGFGEDWLPVKTVDVIIYRDKAVQKKGALNEKR